MPRVCQFSGKKTKSGRTYTTRGLAKSKGGVGKKTTGKTLRRFRPNIQKVRAVINGRTVRVKVTAKLLRRGIIEKPQKRNYNPEMAE
ncbi:MAG: 50S ribosomal protein L28 [Planctomycetota bacterium]|nr:50S ribosomal protein L28 [Planctomycetota bacterium]